MPGFPAAITRNPLERREYALPHVGSARREEGKERGRDGARTWRTGRRTADGGQGQPDPGQPTPTPRPAPPRPVFLLYPVHQKRRPF